ncbi:MAG TPA: SDR family oxidoreductase [Vicinamibacterales bacterium]
MTGSGGGGCGRAIALRFAREGAKVVVSDIDVDGAHETARLVEAAGCRASVFAADVRDERAVEALIDHACKTFGSLSVLVNNASSTQYHGGSPLDHWPEIVETDFLGAMYATRFAIEAMRRSGGGAIVNLGSISALPHGRVREWPMYDAAKAALIRLTTGLASLNKVCIRVNCLAPGWIAAPEVLDYWGSLTPAQRKENGVPSRLLQLEEVAAAVVRLATDESLYGRVLVWDSEDVPRLIEWADRGYAGTTVLVL